MDNKKDKIESIMEIVTLSPDNQDIKFITNYKKDKVASLVEILTLSPEDRDRMFEIGDPSPTKYYTLKELQKENLVGLYEITGLSKFFGLQYKKYNSKYKKVKFWTYGPGQTSHRRGWEICDIRAGELITGVLPFEIVNLIREGKIIRRKGIFESSFTDRVAIIEDKIDTKGNRKIFFPRKGNVW